MTRYAHNDPVETAQRGVRYPGHARFNGLDDFLRVHFNGLFFWADSDFNRWRMEIPNYGL